jgi:hypothetical protein
VKQSFQIPEGMAKEFRQIGGQMGHGGIKVLGTAAIAFILSLDENGQRILAEYVRHQTWKDSSELDPEKINELVKMLLDDESDAIPLIEPVWRVDKKNQ